MLSRLTQRYPTLVASLLYALTSALVFWPIAAGKFLVNEHSDMRTGFAFRDFAVSYFREHGSLPEWMPYLYGGIPFVANTAHGDTFFPTFLLRLAFGADTGVSLSFAVFVFLCGLFTFVFLRTLGLSWAASFVGGAAYMLTGQILSLVSPGHDGKMYVSSLLPLALGFLYQAVARRDWTRYLFLGVTIGFSLLSPHVQLTYYLLMAIGFFWLYMVFFSAEKPVEVPWWKSAALFVMSLAVGFAFAGVQLLPFVEFIPFSPRQAGGERGGYAYGTTFSMPPEEFLGALWGTFSGTLDAYWGRNVFKLHSGYIGVVTLMLATFAFYLKSHRRLTWFFVFLGVYGLLFAFGGHTPFYALPYHLLPGLSKTRAPDMIFFLVAFSAAVLAAFGTQWVVEARARGEIRRTPLYWWLGVLGAAVLLAATGGFRALMTSLASLPTLGQEMADPRRLDAAEANYPAFVLDTIRVLAFGAITAAIVWFGARRKVPAELLGLALGVLVLADLWSVGRRFVQWSPPARELFAADDVVRELKKDTTLFRVLRERDLRDNYLPTHRIRSALGYHGNQLQDYNELLGGMGVFQYLGSPNVLKLIGIRYIVSPESLNVPVFVPVGTGRFRAWEGDSAYLYRYADALPYAYLVPEAVKVEDEQIVPTLIDPRFDPRRLALVPRDAAAGVEGLSALPEPIEAEVRIHEVHEGRFHVTLPTPLAKPAYLIVAENWYPAWRATVKGQEVPVVRAQNTLIGVALPAGAQEVDLVFRSRSYRLGAALTIFTALLVTGLALFSRTSKRRRAASE